jgi:hypothetical protein
MIVGDELLDGTKKWSARRLLRRSCQRQFTLVSLRSPYTKVCVALVFCPPLRVPRNAHFCKATAHLICEHFVGLTVIVTFTRFKVQSSDFPSCFQASFSFWKLMRGMVFLIMGFPFPENSKDNSTSACPYAFYGRVERINELSIIGKSSITSVFRCEVVSHYKEGIRTEMARQVLIAGF